MCNICLQGWKGNAIYEFEKGISIHWGFTHKLTHTDIKETLWKKNQDNKIKDSGEAYDKSFYWCSQLNSIWKENSAILLFYLLTL